MRFGLCPALASVCLVLCGNVVLAMTGESEASLRDLFAQADAHVWSVSSQANALLQIYGDRKQNTFFSR